MTNGILCAIDLSASTSSVLTWSIQLAKKLNAPLTILYAYRIFQHNGEGAAVKRKMEEDAAAKFKVLEKELLHDKSVAYTFKTEVGFVEDRIKAHAKNNKTSFLVMDKSVGTKKESFDELLENLQIPLVLVP